MAEALDAHFHCLHCDPVLVRGRTRGICGEVIPPPIVGKGSWRKCPSCKASRREHRKSHRR